MHSYLTLKNPTVHIKKSSKFSDGTKTQSEYSILYNSYVTLLYKTQSLKAWIRLTIPTAALSNGFPGTFSGTCCNTFDLNGRSSGGHCKLSPVGESSRIKYS